MTRLTTGQGAGVTPPGGHDRRLIEAAIDNDVAALKAALAAHADINAQDEDGMTALHHAAGNGARACLRILIATTHCDFLLQDAFGRYAADLAIEWARDHAVGRLLTIRQIVQARQHNVPAWILAERRGPPRPS